MAFSWRNLFKGEVNHSGEIPNENPAPADPPTVGYTDYSPGDPDGVDLSAFADRGMGEPLQRVSASPWDGWPSEWSTPNWGDTGWTASGKKLVDTAFSAIDLNGSILSTLPMFRLRDGEIQDPLTWQINPDPIAYTGWSEFLKQAYWDYMCAGEAFILALSRDSNGRPSQFRVIPPWMVEVSMRGGVRTYEIGRIDVTADILHIRYSSSTSGLRGVGPLEAAGARVTASALLTQYYSNVTEQGGVPPYALIADQFMTREQARDAKQAWIDSRRAGPGEPAVLGGGMSIETYSESAKDMMFLEFAQFNESRIAVLLGVPPALVDLTGSGESMTYTNTEMQFSFHDRAFLRPKGKALLEALSYWALPRGTWVELNYDEYSRPGFQDRANAYSQLASIGAIGVDEVRRLERLHGQVGATVGSESVEPAATIEPSQNDEGE